MKAIGDAIDKQAEEDGEELFTDVKSNNYAESEELDFDKLIEEFKATAEKFLEEDANYWAPRITEVVEKYIGCGKKVMDCDRRQVEAIDLIVTDLKELKK